MHDNEFCKDTVRIFFFGGYKKKKGCVGGRLARSIFTPSPTTIRFNYIYFLYANKLTTKSIFFFTSSSSASSSSFAFVDSTHSHTTRRSTRSKKYVRQIRPFAGFDSRSSITNPAR